MYRVLPTLAGICLAVVSLFETEASVVSPDAHEALKEFAKERGLQSVGDAYRLVKREMGENGLFELEEAYKLRKMQRIETQAREQKRAAELEAQAREQRQQKRATVLEAQAREQRKQLKDMERQQQRQAAELEAQAREQRKQHKALLEMQLDSTYAQMRGFYAQLQGKDGTWGQYGQITQNINLLSDQAAMLEKQIAELEQ